MKRSELVALRMAYNSIKQAKQDGGEALRFEPMFLFTMERNIKKMSTEIESIALLENQVKTLQEDYRNKRLLIVDKYVSKENGEYKTHDDNFLFESQEDEINFIAEVTPIDVAYKEDIEKYKKTFLDLMEEDIDEAKIDIKKHATIDFKITADEASGLLPFMED